MRINLSRRTLKGGQDKFVKEFIRDFADEFDLSNISSATAYVTTGKQGLSAFVAFLNDRGFKASSYYLEPNKDLLLDVGEDWAKVTRCSPSYGIIIPDDDPKLVEFKLKNL